MTHGFHGFSEKTDVFPMLFLQGLSQGPHLAQPRFFRSFPSAPWAAKVAPWLQQICLWAPWHRFRMIWGDPAGSLDVEVQWIQKKRPGTRIWMTGIWLSGLTNCSIDFPQAWLYHPNVGCSCASLGLMCCANNMCQKKIH